MITIVDYGIGNLGSVQNMFKRVGAQATITKNPDVIAQATKILLPGVGAFDPAMRQIVASGLQDVLNHKAMVEKVPVLGICLGMQLLTQGSEEGALPGLGWVKARCHRFPSMPDLRVPHMGWNLATPATPSPLTKGLEKDARFYFVHSYYVQVEDSSQSILKTHYGVTFDAALQAGNIYGAQFHPEKSHRFGMQLFKNFAEVC